MDEQKSRKAIFLITTDGLENSSREYNKARIKEMIKGHKEWEFIYIGANIDSYSEGQSIGIDTRNIANYKKDKKGIQNMFNAINRVSNNYYMGEEINSSWKEDLE